MNIAPIDGIDDVAERLARQDAFWDRAIIDRPVICIRAPRASGEQEPCPERTFATQRDRWFDVEYQADVAWAAARNTLCLGDAIPCANPNLGPEIFSAFFGCELEYGAHTSWSIPCLSDWDDADQRLRFSKDNPYFRAIETLTQAFIERGRNTFYTGLTDLHPGGDAIAAFRDPLNLNLDMLEHVEPIKRLLPRLHEAFVEVMNHFVALLRAHGQPITCWAGIVSNRTWYVPSNDFSCMISKAMFDDVFLPGIAEECRFLEASIYHLDGPDALRHLDSLLAIPELNAIQWVYGAGNGRASDWMHIYKRIQDAGKGLQVHIAPDELDRFVQTLKPEGVWLASYVSSRAEGEALLRRVARWR